MSPQLAGEMIVPAVVVFRNMEPDAMKTIVAQIAPSLVSHIVSVTQEQGAKASRIVLHCRTRHIEQVHTIIPLLEAKGMPTQAYIARKSQQAAQDLQNATSNAGICHYFCGKSELPVLRKMQIQVLSVGGHTHPLQESKKEKRKRVGGQSIYVVYVGVLESKGNNRKG